MSTPIVVHFGPEICGAYGSATEREWLVTNGLGGFACGTVAGIQTRRYHGLLVASLPARLLFPGDFAYAMQFSAQFASAAASVLLVAPLFWMGRQLFNRRVAFWAALVFQCLLMDQKCTLQGVAVLLAGRTGSFNFVAQLALARVPM